MLGTLKKYTPKNAVVDTMINMQCCNFMHGYTYDLIISINECSKWPKCFLHIHLPDQEIHLPPSSGFVRPAPICNLVNLISEHGKWPKGHTQSELN